MNPILKMNASTPTVSDALSDETFFSVFGKGAGWMQGMMNGLIGTFFAISILVFSTKFVMTAIKAKTSENDEEKQKIRKGNVKNVIAILILLAISSSIFAFINLFKLHNVEFNNKSVFDNLFRDKKLAEQAQEYFNLIMTLLIAIAIGIFIIVMPLKLIKYISSDDEGKVKLRKNMISSTLWLIAIVSILFITSIVINILPEFKSFANKE